MGTNRKLTIILLLFPQVLLAQFGYLTGHINDKFGAVYQAEVSLENTHYGLSTEIDGYFAFQLDTGRYTLLIEKDGYKPKRQNIDVKDFQTTEVQILIESIILEQVVSSGTLSQTLIRQAESSVPIDVIKGQDIMNTHQPNLSAALNYLIPTLYSVNQTIADGSDFVDPVSMRGLSPDQLLVLVNGKRRHKSALLHVNGTFGRGSAGTDLNTISMASISHIEVLRYGAAAQYGSDAIAGVLNIVLKDRDERALFQAELGMTNDGGGEVFKIFGTYGFKIGDQGFMSVDLEFMEQTALNRSGAYQGLIYGDARDQDDISRKQFFNQTGYTDNRVMIAGAPESQNALFGLNGAININENIEIYAFGTLSYRNGQSTGFYRMPYDSTKVVHRLYPSGFSPEIHPTIFDQQFVIGERGKVNNWWMDISFNFGKNSMEYSIENSLNASMGVNSPLAVRAGGYDYGQKLVNINLSRPLDLGIPTTLSIGAEYRIENYDIRMGDENSYINGGDTTNSGQQRKIGFQVYTGFTPENVVDKLRTNIAGFVELKADISPKLEIIAASRLESYFNSYGFNFSVKTTGRYKFSDYAIVRGGFSTGYKAPSLHQLYYNRNSTQFINGQAQSVANFNNESYVAKAFQIPELEPELSKNYSLGITSMLFRNINMSLDLFRIDVSNRIVQTGLFNQDDDPIYKAILEPLNVESAQFMTNAVTTKTHGLDLVMNYKLLSGSNDISAEFGYNISRSQVTDIHASDVLNEKKEILFGREEVARLETNAPRHKGILNLRYAREKWSVNLRNTFFGSVTYRHSDDGDPANWVVNDFSGLVESRDQEYSPRIVTDLVFSYQPVENSLISVGANNLLNVYPDKISHSANTNDGVFIYSRRVQQFGVKGAYYYISFKVIL